ncbi:hypothetical protein QSH18_21690 [Xanthomonas sp. NCPPB 2654]|uniref:hypothetical protein n=1 Tax=unclassified Xanthomonas TaxID=2643310 RepID=UPI0021DF63F2|nr:MULTISPECIES: hypothetical protein [unclassified Xanthomonas]MDL5368228.1 hypothetical protein [Xanthomonas sp. NCPPB 2654]UYC19358.1 hypothetical protein NUG20_14360 [Xanthomonas sp. CFBP 8443]
MDARFVALSTLLLAASTFAAPAAAKGTQLDCQPGSQAVCEEWCTHAGGGMSSNPDGSVTCTVMASARSKKGFALPEGSYQIRKIADDPGHGKASGADTAPPKAKDKH